MADTQQAANDRRFLALVRDGVAFDFTAISIPPADLLAAAQACIDGEDPDVLLLAAAGDGNPVETARVIVTQADNAQAALAAELPDDVTLVAIERGFDPQTETVDPISGAIVPDLARAVVAAHDRIDAEYEARVSVAGPVKAAEHAAKLAEARALINGDDPGPMLLAEAVDGDVDALALAIIARADAAAESLARVASARRAAKLAASEAHDAASARAAADAFIEFLINLK